MIDLSYFSVFLVISLSFLVGIAVLRLLQIKVSFLETIGLSFGLGGGLLSFQIFLYILFNITLSREVILVPWVLFFLFYASFFIREIRIPLPKIKYGYLSAIFFFLILLNVLFVFVQSQLRPLQSWDAIANWSLLSKATFIDKTVTGDFYTFANFDIPYLVSFQETLIYLVNGSVIDRQVLLLFPVYFLSLLLLFYSAVRKFLSLNLSLLFTFLLASLPNMLRQAGTYDIGYVDISLSYYMFAGVVLFLHILDGKSEKGITILIGIFMAFMTLVKGEGQGLAISFFLVLSWFFYKKNMVSKLMWLLPGVIIYISWKYFTLTQDVPVHYLYSGKLQLQRIVTIFYLYLVEFLNIIRWNFLWVTLATTLFFAVMKRKTNIVFILLVLQLFFYMGIYLYTPAEVSDHIRGSLDRFLLQISPLALFSIAYVYSGSRYYEKN